MRMRTKLIDRVVACSADAAMNPHSPDDMLIFGWRDSGRSRHQRQREMPDGHAFKSNRKEACVQMPKENGQISPSTNVRAAQVAGSRLHLARSCRKVGKA